jgi:hypothetical protein
MRAEADRHGRRAQDAGEPRAFRLAQRVEQPHDVGDALRGLHAARLGEQVAALHHVDREAHELRDHEPRQQHRHQAAEERSGDERHRFAATTSVAST